MVRVRTQKGGGFLNRLRGFFGTRKVSPSLPVQQPKVRIPLINTRNETFADALKRDYVFLYFKLHGQDPPIEKRFITPQQEAEVRRVLLDADAQGLSADEIVRHIFHADRKQFDDEFSAWEKHLPDGYLNKGTEYERRAFNVAGSLQRFIATLKVKQTPRHITYASNFQTHICKSTNLDELATSLTDDYCVTLLTPQNESMFEPGKGYAYAASYMIVQPQFFPTGAAGPIVLNAHRLLSVSFVIDAFQQNGVLSIEPTLHATLQREAPELLAFSKQDPVVLLVPYYLKDASTTQGRFLVVDPSVLGRGRNVVNMKQLQKNPTVQDAFARQKVYGMDPKTMYEIRTSFPQLWLATFGYVNNATYQRFTPQEKLAFCFLQYTKFQELYSLQRNPQTTNNNSTVARKTLQATQEATRQVFAADYEHGADPYDLADNFQAADQENLRELVRVQEELFDKATVKTPTDVRRLLSKFTTQRSVSTGPTVVNYFGPSRVNLGANVGTLATATRKQRVNQMLTPQNVQKERNEITRRYKQALSTPVKTSRVPNFLRSKAAKEANTKRYMNRLQSIQREFRALNERHGLQTKSGYGYVF